MSTATRLPAPPNGNGSESSHTSETHKLVRVRNFMVDGHESVVRALSQLQNERATGTLLVDINSGGIGTIRFQEEQRVTFNSPSVEK